MKQKLRNFFRAITVVIAVVSGCKTPSPQAMLFEHEPTAIGFTGNTATKAVFYGKTVRDDNLEIRLLSLFLKLEDNITPEEFLEDGPFLHRNKTPFELYIADLIKRMMQALVQKYPSLSKVPAPDAMLLNAHTFNAFVMPLSACLPYPLTVDGRSGLTARVALITPKHGGAEVKVGEKCFDQIAPSELDLNRDIPDILSFFEVEAPDCGLTWDTNRQTFLLVPGDGCTFPEGVSGSNSLAILRTSSTIYLHAGMFDKNTTFNDFIAILGHELIHYVRGHAHASFTQDFEDIFFDASARSYPAIPDQLSEPDLAPFHTLATQSSNVFDLTDATFHGSLMKLFKTQTFGRAPQNICAGNRDEGQCQTEYRSLATELSSFLQSTTYPASPFLHIELEQEYLTLERRLTALMSEVPFHNWYGGILPDYLINSGIYTAALEDEDLSGFDPAENTLAYLEIVSAKLRAKDIPAFQERDRLAALHYGKYTAEVEADEGMVELLALVGLSAEVSNSAFLKMQAHVEGSAGGVSIYNYPAIVCQRTRETNWEEPPLWGSFRARHPNPCWRTYNLDKLKAAVSFMPVAPISQEALSELKNKYEALRNELADLRERGQF